MDDKERCQSCGMPLGPGFYGTEADGTESAKYCKYCFQNGEFTMPEMTVDDAIRMSVEQMTKQQGMDEGAAERLARETMPQLERWQS